MTIRPNLARPIARVDALMADCETVHIEHEGNTAPGTINRSTGALTEGAWTDVYTGSAIIKSSLGTFGDEQGNPEQIMLYEVLLPTTATVPGSGDRITVTASHRDPALVGIQLWVTGVERNSFLVARKVHALEYEAARVRFTGGGG